MNRPLQWITTAVLGAAATLMTSFGLLATLIFLLPHLRGLHEAPGASARQRVISQVVSAIDKVAVDTEKNLLDIQTHLFMLSQAPARGRPRSAGPGRWP